MCNNWVLTGVRWVVVKCMLYSMNTGRKMLCEQTSYGLLCTHNSTQPTVRGFLMTGYEKFKMAGKILKGKINHDYTLLTREELMSKLSLANEWLLKNENHPNYSLALERRDQIEEVLNYKLLVWRLMGSWETITSRFLGAMSCETQDRVGAMTWRRPECEPSNSRTHRLFNKQLKTQVYGWLPSC